MGIIETIASWFAFLSAIMGWAFDAFIIFLFGLAGMLYVALRHLVLWFVDECWEAVRQGLAEGIVQMLDTLGLFPDVEVEDIMYWLELANKFFPLSEALAWLESYWAFRLAQWSWKTLKSLLPW